jgi:pimeloyl-ACP methyl ester carboxylesterase
VITAAKDGPSAYEAAIKAASPNGPPSEALASGVKRMTGAWARNFLAYDPGPTLRALHIPVLALVGGKDVQVVAAQNMPALRAALAGNPRAKVMELPGLNHLFQTAGTGSPAEYGKIDETIAPSALKIMGDWIEGVTR